MPTAAPPRPVSSTFLNQRGTSRAIYAVTGVVDEVNDLILPGAFTRTLAARPVKTVWHHAWKDPVGVVVECEEWLPGDSRFKSVPDWPAEAGALVARVIYNLRTSQGRDAYEQVRQWHEHKQAAFSIGYRVPETGATLRGDGVRMIHTLDLYEVSPVLHGAHPLTRSLEVKSAVAGDHEALEYKATPTAVGIDVDTAPKTEDVVKVAGLVVKAADTGRVLMIQRALDDSDPAAGTWEFPGGHREDGEDALAAALREWAEETGSTLPGATSVVGAWTNANSVYRLYVAIVPTEASVPINAPHDERRVTNPDDPDGDATEVTAWWPITVLPNMPLLRPECRDTPWDLLVGASLPQAPAALEAAPLDAAAGITAAALEEKSAHAAVKAARARPRIEHKSARAMVAEAKAAGGTDQNRGDAEQLRHWYVRGEGAAQVAWGSPGDFDRCVSIAGRHLSPENAKGYCNLRHKDALGVYPATHAAAEGKSARRAVLEAKARLSTAPGDSMDPIQPLPASHEQIRDRLGQAVRVLLAPDEDAWACIQGTYPDHVIASVYTGGEEEAHYLVPYTLTGDDVDLGTPKPVTLATVVVPDDDDPREADENEEAEARVVQPTVDALSDATARISTTAAGPEQLQGVRDKVRALIAALSAKGLHTNDDEPPARRQPGAGAPTGLDLWEDSDEEMPDDALDPDDDDSDDDEDDPTRKPDEDTVRLDAEEVKAALAAIRN
ncbi:NUDIX domain-containing protein [Streptomyces sp. NPDC046976]|uniref:NUDIX domain-containing protein n=1 Tax=Streptomyces sp. NPDC046976 TaxID=3155258 RepID=UPI0033FE76D1